MIRSWCRNGLYGACYIPNEREKDDEQDGGGGFVVKSAV